MITLKIRIKMTLKKIFKTMSGRQMVKNIVNGSLLVFMCSAAAFAQITIEDVNWQVSKIVGAKRLPFVKVKEVLIKPEGKINEKIRILVSVRNEGNKVVEGLVLRYALKFKIVKLNSADDTAIWSVPFRIEELRISKIKSSREQTVKILNTGINTELKKLRSNGFWIDAIGMEIMIEPRKGDDLNKNIHQSVITSKQ
ncbi:MAG: hypothetical protein KAR84_02860 [Elusimicrobiales bacterium]|nr:hypothetical protein [Elusimicrobiales bacterium]MCK5583075.1 hypothetical protein [Elusimicrobiales bacterium]